jgi:predicted metal-dependent enzyme (double-stranded beta helix superfamily)
MLDARLLQDIAAGIAQARSLWEDETVPDPDERRCVRLLATDAYEVWVIAWAPGQAADLHDHGRSVGNLTVVEGALTERAVDEAGVRAEVLQAGDVRYLPAGLVHEVVNLSDEPAISIHVYAPPLSHMTRYDEETLTPTVTELLAHPSLIGD